jgi:hypothetical protein
MSFIMGSMLGEFEPTAEMLSRTKPNLFDLIVAVLAGFAGAYALIDEKISPALPGVAIATAIVPPLANCGLCLALGVVEGAAGSFLLFVANFLSILLVTSTTFVLSGMAKQYGAKLKGWDYVRRFGLPFVAFILIAAFLQHSLLEFFEERRVSKAIKTVLIGELSKMPATDLNYVQHFVEDGRLNVLASVFTPVMMSPTSVAKLQDQLSERLGKPSDLIVHCVMSNNVSASGSVKNVVEPQLDGTFVASSESETLKAIAKTEQIIREHFSEDPVLDLHRVDFLTIARNRVMLAHAFTVKDLTEDTIKLLEKRVHEALGDDSIPLVFNCFRSSLKTAEGQLRYGWILGDKSTPAVRERVRSVREDLGAAFDRNEAYELVAVNATQLDGKLHFLLEITGPTLYPRKDLEALENELTQKHSEPIDLYAWSRIEVIHGPQGFRSLRDLNRYFGARQKENLPGELEAMLEAAGRFQ